MNPSRVEVQRENLCNQHLQSPTHALRLAHVGRTGYDKERQCITQQENEFLKTLMKDSPTQVPFFFVIGGNKL